MVHDNTKQSPVYPHKDTGNAELSPTPRRSLNGWSSGVHYKRAFIILLMYAENANRWVTVPGPPVRQHGSAGLVLCVVLTTDVIAVHRVLRKDSRPEIASVAGRSLHN